MSSSKFRNFAVGATVLAALIVLGWMIFKFGAEPAKFFKPPQLAVTFTSERGDGLGDGSNINYKGIQVGRVLKVRRDPAQDIIVIDAVLDKEPPLPANLEADIVFGSPLGGVSSLELHITGPKPEGVIADGAKLNARYLGSTFLPPEFAEVARNLNQTIREFNDLKLLASLKETVELTKQRINEAGQVIDGVSSLVNDPKLRDNLQGSMAAIRTTSENAREITERLKTLTERFASITDNTDKAVVKANETLTVTQKRIDELGASLGEQLITLGSVLKDLNSITSKVDKGQGTAGLLVNDPKLYEALVETMKKVDATMATVERLVEQWEQEGLHFKLGK